MSYNNYCIIIYIGSIIPVIITITNQSIGIIQAAPCQAAALRTPAFAILCKHIYIYIYIIIYDYMCIYVYMYMSAYIYIYI